MMTVIDEIEDLTYLVWLILAELIRLVFGILLILLFVGRARATRMLYSKLKSVHSQIYILTYVQTRTPKCVLLRSLPHARLHTWAVVGG